MTTEQSGRAGRVAGLTGMFAGLVLGLLAAASPERTAAAAVPGAAQPNAKANANALPHPTAAEMQKIGWIGANACKQCHDTPDPTMNDEYKSTRGFDFVRLQENKVWGVHDLHSTAFKNLVTSRTPEDIRFGATGSNATAQRMEDNLRASGSQAKYRDANYTVATDTQCLACHASTKQPTALAPHSEWTTDSFQPRDGVGCEMCHGHGSQYRFRHGESRIDKKAAPKGAESVVDWREADPGIKSEWGLVNLRDHATATSQCASCHIGNLRDGRFVTHEMYAVGHPPLPPLDLVAYTREQPRHWGLPKELPYFDTLDKDKALAIFSIRVGESHPTRRFAESTIAGLRSAVVLSQQLADLGKDSGLDFAAFDCSSCHHNLKYPSDRQARGYVGIPGRPLFRPAAFVMAKVVTEHAATMPGASVELKKAYEDLLKAEQALLGAFAVKSFGDPAKIKDAAAGIEAWSIATLKLLGQVKYDEAQTKTLLAKLVEATQKPVADPEVAQLLMWGVETLAINRLPAGPDNTAPEALAKLDTSLKPYVVTRLREGNVYPFEVKPGTKGPALDAVDKRISGRMKTFNSFESAVFKKAYSDVKPELLK